MTQRKELQKHSNILLKSFGVSDFLTVIASLPAVTSTILISFQGFLELVCTVYNEAMTLGFLVTFSQYHLTMVAWERFVAVRKWMDYKVIVTKRRLINITIFAIGLVVGDFHARLPLHIMGCNQRWHWAETNLDYDYKCLCNVERCYLRLFLRHDLPRNTPTSDER